MKVMQIVSWYRGDHGGHNRVIKGSKVMVKMAEDVKVPEKNNNASLLSSPRSMKPSRRNKNIRKNLKELNGG